MSEDNSVGIMFGGLVLGAVLGAGLALVFAPMAGGDARRRLTDTGRRLKEGVEDGIDHAKGLVRDGTEKLAGAIESERDTSRRSVRGAQ